MANKTENKVKFNLKNVHYALITGESDGILQFGTPKAWPGARTLTMDPSGDATEFYADGIKYYVTHANQGYTGSLEMARIIDAFRVDVLKERVDKNGVMVEDATVEPASFALLFEFDGDAHSTRHILYNVSAGRPSAGSQTTEGSKEPVTESADMTASPMKGGYVKASTTKETDEQTYNNWFKTVYLPDFSEAQSTEKTETTGEG